MASDPAPQMMAKPRRFADMRGEKTEGVRSTPANDALSVEENMRKLALFKGDDAPEPVATHPGQSPGVEEEPKVTQCYQMLRRSMAKGSQGE